jgi:uncharacterized protein YqfA (UPF0365 family)
MRPEVLVAVGIALAALVGIVLVVVLARYLGLWFWGFTTQARVGLPSLVLMSIRKVNPRSIVEAKVIAAQAGLSDVTAPALEAHVLAGGNVKRVVRALVIAHRARIPLDWRTASAIDLAGRNVLEAVSMSVDPRVIDCPGTNTPGRNTLNGVSKDGIQLQVLARVTVRTNLAQLVGGATEETVIARVGEGIVSAIGSAANYREVLANPAVITRRVLEKGLDSQTAFEIVSIDIAQIEVAQNVGARLQVNQAEADMRVARAKAEERRARAIATEQEMVALAAENRAKVVLAESAVPQGQAAAFRDGNLGKTARKFTRPHGRAGMRR